MRALLTALALCLSTPAPAETVVAVRTLRAQTVLGSGDLTLAEGIVPGAVTDPDDAIGLETRVAIYQGQPVMPATLGPPAIIDRNQVVPLRYLVGALIITADGRALDRAGIGDRVRVMNTASRTTVTGTVAADGAVDVTRER